MSVHHHQSCSRCTHYLRRTWLGMVRSVCFPSGDLPIPRWLRKRRASTGVTQPRRMWLSPVALPITPVCLLLPAILWHLATEYVCIMLFNVCSSIENCYTAVALVCIIVVLNFCCCFVTCDSLSSLLNLLTLCSYTCCTYCWGG